jgi:DNA-binding NarL/FixJ family response regulator
MPEMTGIEATREICKTSLQSKILIFTMHDSKSLPEYVRTAGACGYVLKSRAAHDLVSALEGILAGGTFFESDSKTAVGKKAESHSRPIS